MRDLANDLYPFYEPGGFPTCHATTVIRGKRCVAVSGNRTGGPGLSTDLENLYKVKECDTQGQQVLGIAKYDAEDETPVGVIASPGAIVPVTAGAAIVAGALVMTDNQGRAITYVGAALTGDAQALPAVPAPFGVCMTAASGAGVDAEIKLF